MSALEALLLVAPEPLTTGRAAAAAGVEEEEARAALEALRQEYASRRSGLEVVEVAGGWRLVTRAEFDTLVTRLEPSRTVPPLSPAALETLAVVAYRQPLTRAEIEAVRGVRCEGVLATLVERGLVEEVGRREGPGRPILYGTTRWFLEYFGLRELGDLPPLPETAEGTDEGATEGNGAAARADS
ncbi:MAG: SMC-Scp complex subunit ScpB [Firmicutes bacterium]|nr:SMC-Scp complex subunit ScpB [Bacillota bacterium]